MDKMMPKELQKWDELLIEDKINHLRDAIRDLRRSLCYMADMARQAKSMAEQHEHGTGGTPLFKPHVFQQNIGQGSMRDDLA